MTIDKDVIGYRPCPGPTGLAIWVSQYMRCVRGMPEFNSDQKAIGRERHIPEPTIKSRDSLPYSSKCSLWVFHEELSRMQDLLLGKNSHITNADAQLLIQTNNCILRICTKMRSIALYSPTPKLKRRSLVQFGIGIRQTNMRLTRISTQKHRPNKPLKF